MKTVSRHWLAKTVAIFLICMLVWMAAKEARTLVERGEDGNLSISVEALFENEYMHSESFIGALVWRAQDICSELYFNDGHQQYDITGPGIEYYGKLGSEVISSGVDASYFNSGTCQYIMYQDGRPVEFGDRIEKRRVENNYLPYDTNNLPKQTLHTADETGEIISSDMVTVPGAEGQGEATIYVGMSNEAIAKAEADFRQANALFRDGISNIAKLLLPALLLMFYLCVVAGRKGGGSELHLSPIDKLWTELTALGLLSTLVCTPGLVGVCIYEFFARGASGSQQFLGDILLVMFSAGGTLVAILLTMSFARKCKAKTVIKGSLTGKACRLIRSVCRGTKELFVNLFDGKPYAKYCFSDVLYRRQRTFLLLSAANVVAFWVFIWVFVGIIFPIFEIYLVYKYIKANNETYRDMGKILDQVNEIEQGNLSYDPAIDSTSPLRPCSDKLMNISSGMQKSVEKQISSERTKIELVTNVSHDLKTPLTSIIGYIDLLQKEQLAPEARDYVDVLAQKSEKLKNIVSDVFELAKSTSGNLEMSQEALDFKKLVEQNMADLEDKIMASGLAIRISMPEEPVNIVADGKRLTRVLQNIMDNALNYSLKGSRIFVTLKNNGHLTVQNTAGYEMEFTAAEITERFARGDKSRSDGGSGLGLSIAQSFTAACGGEFIVHVDGDQFKVEIVFPISRAPQVQKAPYTEIEQNDGENM